jgi:hypothetical protein
MRPSRQATYLRLPRRAARSKRPMVAKLLGALIGQALPPPHLRKVLTPVPIALQQAIQARRIDLAAAWEHNQGDNDEHETV